MIWTHKHLDKVTEISQLYVNDLSIPTFSRSEFSDALSVARNVRAQPKAEQRHNLKHAFNVMCKAAHGAGLCRCKEAQGDLVFCQLISSH